MQIHNTEDWDWPAIAKYGPDLTAAFYKLAERFPNDIHVPTLARAIIAGEYTLWLILDGETFKAFVLSQIKVNEPLNHSICVLTNGAGEGGPDLSEMLEPIEEWAKANGCDEILAMGRFGWRKALGAKGYRPDTIYFRKGLK